LTQITTAGLEDINEEEVATGSGAMSKQSGDLPASRRTQTKSLWSGIPVSQR
jgi:hypothetical protein